MDNGLIVGASLAPALSSLILFNLYVLYDLLDL